jgi:thiol-disulfide isomerase/thioredoxin
MKRYYRLMMLLFLLALLLNPAALPAQTGTNLSFKKLDGSNLGLGDLQGKVVVISFSAKGIPLTRFEMPQLDKLAAKFADRGVAVLWVGCNSIKPKAPNYASDDDLRALAAQYPNLLIVRDPNETASRQAGIDSLPTILVFDQRGRVVGAPHTGIDPQSNLASDLTPVINRLLTQ